ncbi:Uncharacterised protein [Chlamydia trachomatis]|nr:Uncharacterised protein [Chlamydia trachomatis]
MRKQLYRSTLAPFPQNRMNSSPPSDEDGGSCNLSNTLLHYLPHFRKGATAVQPHQGYGGWYNKKDYRHGAFDLGL